MSAIQGVSEQKLNDLAFADDVALLEKSAERAQKQLYISQRSKVSTFQSYMNFHSSVRCETWVCT